jgi:hypothetical protein
VLRSGSREEGSHHVWNSDLVFCSIQPSTPTAEGRHGDKDKSENRKAERHHEGAATDFACGVSKSIETAEIEAIEFKTRAIEAGAIETAAAKFRAGETA